jgi:hypothetical protein
MLTPSLDMTIQLIILIYLESFWKRNGAGLAIMIAIVSIELRIYLWEEPIDLCILGWRAWNWG